MKKFAIIFGAIALIGISSILFIQKVSADENRDSGREERMSTLIAEGDLTEEEAALLEQNHEERRAELEEIRDNDELSFEEKRELMREVHEEYRNRAQELGLSCGEFGGMKGERLGGGEGMGFGMGMGTGTGRGYRYSADE